MGGIRKDRYLLLAALALAGCGESPGDSRVDAIRGLWEPQYTSYDGFFDIGRMAVFVRGDSVFLIDHHGETMVAGGVTQLSDSGTYRFHFPVGSRIEGARIAVEDLSVVLRGTELRLVKDTSFYYARVKATSSTPDSMYLGGLATWNYWDELCHYLAEKERFEDLDAVPYEIVYASHLQQHREFLARFRTKILNQKIKRVDVEAVEHAAERARLLSELEKLYRSAALRGLNRAELELEATELSRRWEELDTQALILRSTLARRHQREFTSP